MTRWHYPRVFCSLPQALGPRATAISTVCPSNPDLHSMETSRVWNPSASPSVLLLAFAWRSHVEAHLCPQWCGVISLHHPSHHHLTASSITSSSHCIIHHVIISLHHLWCYLTASSHCIISLHHSWCHLTASPHCIIHDVISLHHLTVWPHCMTSLYHLTVWPHCITSLYDVTASPHCMTSLYHPRCEPYSLTWGRWVLGKCSFTFVCFAFVAHEKIKIKYINIICWMFKCMNELLNAYYNMDV